MSDEDAFLRAIQADPADHLPKLVYADWLDEHGHHEKAEYIRDAVAGKNTNELMRLHTPHGRVWLELFTSHTRLWDAPTLLALGRLQGLLDGLAAANDHTANISFGYSAALHQWTGELPSQVGTLYGWVRRGEPVLVPLDEWRTTLRAEIARWVGMEQGVASPRAVVQRAHQTSRGCEGTADRVLNLITEVMTPERGWRIDPPPGQRWGIVYAHFLLTGNGRALHLTFEFDD